MATLQEKLIICIWSAALFILVMLPQTFALTSRISTINLYDTQTNCPTNLGIIVHTVVFFILTYLSMWRSDLSAGLKLKFSIYGTLLFYLVASPTFFSVIDYVAGNHLSNENGCPSVAGVVVSAILYLLGLLGLMYLPPELK